MARVAEGFGYVLQGSSAKELQPGDIVTANGGAKPVFRASSLSAMKLDFFRVRVEFLNGLLTVAEGHELQTPPKARREELIFFPAEAPMAQKFTRLARQTNRESLAGRTALLQLWSQVVPTVLPHEPPHGDDRKLRERFRHFVAQLPHAELARQSLTELAAQLPCSERHFSRLFRAEFGVSLRNRQTELRLERARELLASSDAKVSVIARQSGYQHIGLFNAMFKRRFGMTPSEWRAKATTGNA